MDVIQSRNIVKQYTSLATHWIDHWAAVTFEKHLTLVCNRSSCYRSCILK